MDGGPLLHEIEMPLPITPGQVMAAALQEEFAVLVKGNGRIGSVAFFLDYEMLSGDRLKRDLAQILVPRLEARTLDMWRAGVFI